MITEINMIDKKKKRNKRIKAIIQIMVQTKKTLSSLNYDY